MRVLRALAVAVLVIGPAAAAHVTNAFVQPPSAPSRVAAQVRWLGRAIADGAPQRMQQLFPEGAFFTHVLTGMAAASFGDRTTVAAALAASGEPAIQDGFGSIPALDGGTFYRGWRLLLAGEQVRLTGAGTADLLTEADTVRRALLADPMGVPASYPDGYWPCDAVVAMAAVVRAGQVAGRPVAPAELTAWSDGLDALRDPSTGLLCTVSAPRARRWRVRAAARSRSFRRSGPIWSTRPARATSGSGSSPVSWCGRRAWWGCGSIRSATTPPATSTPDPCCSASRRRPRRSPWPRRAATGTLSWPVTSTRRPSTSGCRWSGRTSAASASACCRSETPSSRGRAECRSRRALRRPARRVRCGGRMRWWHWCRRFQRVGG